MPFGSDSNAAVLARLGDLQVHDLVEKGRYAEIADLLERLATSVAEEECAISLHLVRSARSVCVACDEAREQAAQHGLAERQAQALETSLRRELAELLMHIARMSVAETERTMTSFRSDLRHSASQPRVAEHNRWWRRMQKALDFRSSKHRIDFRIDMSGRAAQRNGREEPRTAVCQQDTRHVRSAPLHNLVAYCLGPFRVYQDDRPVLNWPNGKGKSIFKYLITHRDHPVPKEVLMETFWPEAAPNAGRNNLNVAIYHLRQALLKVGPRSPVLFRKGTYSLNPDLTVWIDIDEFQKHVRVARNNAARGNMLEAVLEYRAADALYQGEFLQEDRYERWMEPLRQQLNSEYATLLDTLVAHYFEAGDYESCTAMCQKMLANDPCQEKAHLTLMRCYGRQGRRYLALKQYHACVEALDRELEITPSAATNDLHERIRSGKDV